MAETGPRTWRSVNGLLLLDKPSGCSSNAALQKARRLFSARKAGHTGSLDPIASGLLPICFGEATKLCSHLLDSDKRYQVLIRLGAETNTCDREGEVISRAEVPLLDVDLICGALASFQGRIKQVPPMYSALKHQGKRLYELARQGVEIERKAREVEIFAIEVLTFDRDSLTLDVKCSKGTYIRSLALDLGRLLGCGGYVEELRRTAVGSFTLDQAQSLEVLGESMDEVERLGVLRPMDAMVLHLPSLHFDADQSRRLNQGQAADLTDPTVTGWTRLYDEAQRFMGLGEALADGRVAPRRVFNLD